MKDMTEMFSNYHNFKKKYTKKQIVAKNKKNAPLAKKYLADSRAERAARKKELAEIRQQRKSRAVSAIDIANPIVPVVEEAKVPAVEAVVETTAPAIEKTAALEISYAYRGGYDYGYKVFEIRNQEQLFYKGKKILSGKEIQYLDVDKKGAEKGDFIRYIDKKGKVQWKSVETLRYKGKAKHFLSNAKKYIKEKLDAKKAAAQLPNVDEKVVPEEGRSVSPILYAYRKEQPVLYIKNQAEVFYKGEKVLDGKDIKCTDVKAGKKKGNFIRYMDKDGKVRWKSVDSLRYKGKAKHFWAKLDKRKFNTVESFDGDSYEWKFSSRGKRDVVMAVGKKDKQGKISVYSPDGLLLKSGLDAVNVRWQNSLDDVQGDYILEYNKDNTKQYYSESLKSLVEVAKAKKAIVAPFVWMARHLRSNAAAM